MLRTVSPRPGFVLSFLAKSEGTLRRPELQTSCRLPPYHKYRWPKHWPSEVLRMLRITEAKSLLSPSITARGAHSLLRLCTMFVLIKNNRPPTADCMYWIPPPIADRYKIYSPLLQSKVSPFADIQKCLWTGQDSLAYIGSWRGVQPGRGTGVEPGGLWSREFIAKIFRKVNTKAYAGACLFRGPICSCVDPHFKAKNHPLNRKNWNAHGVMPTYSVTPRASQ
jgi:hypothetical protein